LSVRRIAPDEAVALMLEAVFAYVDVRSTTEFELGDSAGAFIIPWQLPANQHQADVGMRDNLDFMRVVRRNFGPQDKLIIGCRTGHRSLIAAQRLVDAGFTNVVELRGGFAGGRDAFGRVAAPGWQQADLPVALSAEPGRSYSELSGEGEPA